MNSQPNLDEKTFTLRVPGDLISTTVETLRHETVDLFGTADAPPKWTTLVLDLTAAKMLDSAGLNLVVSLFKRVQLRGGRMQIRYSSPNILRILTFTRLDKHVELVSGPA